MVNPELEAKVKQSPYKAAVQLIALYGDEAEEIAHRSSLTAQTKEMLLDEIKHRRVHLFNRRGF